NLIFNLTIKFSLTSAAFVALTVVPHATEDVVNHQLNNIKNGLASENLSIDEDCLRAALTDILNHRNPDELKLRLDRIVKASEALMPAMKKLFLESGSTLI